MCVSGGLKCIKLKVAASVLCILCDSSLGDFCFSHWGYMFLKILMTKPRKIVVVFKHSIESSYSTDLTFEPLLSYQSLLASTLNR